MKMRNAAGALVAAVILLGPAPSAFASDSDTQHDRDRRCSHGDWNGHDWDDDGYNGDYKYRSYEGDSLQDHNRTGDDWRDRRCYRKCWKGNHDWGHRDHRCHKHWHH